MTLKAAALLAFIPFLGCISKQSPAEVASTDTLKGNENTVVSLLMGDTGKQLVQSNPNTCTFKSKLLGVWGNESSENAIFDIKADSIYYVDNMSSYKYVLAGDTITIFYPDYSYKSKISFQGDSLVMDSQENGQTKFWRFKN